MKGQLSLDLPESLYGPYRLSPSTVALGRAGIAECRAVLADAEKGIDRTETGMVD